MIKDDLAYQDLGGSYFDRLDPMRLTRLLTDFSRRDLRGLVLRLLPFARELSLQIRSKLINQMVNHTEGNAHPHPGKCLAHPAFLFRVIRVGQGTSREPSKQTRPVKRPPLGVAVRYYRPDERVRKAESPGSGAFAKIPGILVQEGRKEKRSKETGR